MACRSRTRHQLPFRCRAAQQGSARRVRRKNLLYPNLPRYLVREVRDLFGRTHTHGAVDREFTAGRYRVSGADTDDDTLVRLRQDSSMHILQIRLSRMARASRKQARGKYGAR